MKLKAMILIGFFTTIMSVDNPKFKTTNKYNPSLSPDGKEVIYYSWVNKKSGIYTTDIKGKNTKLLAGNDYNADMPVWSPDGSKILFRSNKDNPGEMDLYTMDRDGSNIMRLGGHPGGDDTPIGWNHNMTKVYYNGYRDGNGDILVMNIDGSDNDNLTGRPSKEYWGSFTPGQSKIVFETDRDGNQEIYAMNLNGSSQKNLTNNSANDATPKISPDGQYVIFRSDRDGAASIFKMNIDGSKIVRLTGTDSKEFFFSWTSGGKEIVFDSNRSGNYEIYIMNEDGSDVRQITGR